MLLQKKISNLNVIIVKTKKATPLIRQLKKHLLLLSSSSCGLNGRDSDFLFDGECLRAATSNKFI